MPTKTTTKKIMAMDPDEFWQAQNKALNTTTVAKTPKPKEDPIKKALSDKESQQEASGAAALGDKTVPYGYVGDMSHENGRWVKARKPKLI